MEYFELLEIRSPVPPPLTNLTGGIREGEVVRERSRGC